MCPYQNLSQSLVLYHAPTRPWRLPVKTLPAPRKGSVPVSSWNEGRFPATKLAAWHALLHAHRAVCLLHVTPLWITATHKSREEPLASEALPRISYPTTASTLLQTWSAAASARVASELRTIRTNNGLCLWCLFGGARLCRSLHASARICRRYATDASHCRALQLSLRFWRPTRHKAP